MNARTNRPPHKNMLTLYGDAQSGNCYKVQLLLHHLQRPFHWVNMNPVQGDTQTDVFKQLNPAGQIPLLVCENGQTLAESNAILYHLGQVSAYWPDDHWLQAKVLQWLFFEQYSHEPYIAVARYIQLYLGLPDNRRTEYEAKQAGGHKALSIMNQQLTQSDFLVGEHMTLADISLYAYTHVAHEGGFDLSAYPAIEQWIDRIQHQPHHRPMGHVDLTPKN